MTHWKLFQRSSSVLTPKTEWGVGEKESREDRTPHIEREPFKVRLGINNLLLKMQAARKRFSR